MKVERQGNRITITDPEKEEKQKRVKEAKEKLSKANPSNRDLAETLQLILELLTAQRK